MKTLCLCFLLVFSLSVDVVAQRLFLVGIPNQMKADSSRKVLAATLEILMKAAPKDRIQVFDAWTLELIADLRIPEASPGQRLRELAQEIQKLKRFLGRDIDVGWTREGQIRWPQFLTSVASGALKAASAAKTTIILFGQAYYLDQRDAGFVFSSGEFPGDGCALAPSTASIYGCADRRNLLENTSVNFCVLEETFASELERTAIRRFLVVFTAELGARLVSFASSSDQVVERALSGLDTPVTKERIDRTDTAIEIRKVGGSRVESASKAETRPQPPLLNPTPPEAAPSPTPKHSEERSPFQRPVPQDAAEGLRATLKRLPAPKAGFVNIAAVWTVNGRAELVDVDLWVRPGDAAEINFSNMVTPEGRLLRDVRSASTSLSDLGWQSVWEVCELKRACLEDTTLFLNLYRSPGGVTTGIVRIAYDDRVIDEPFSFPAVVGDQAGGQFTRATLCWQRIDLARLRANASTKAAR